MTIGWAITLLDNAEVNERTIQRFAGHKDPSTTHRYYSYERKTKEQQVDAIEGKKISG